MATILGLKDIKDNKGYFITRIIAAILVGLSFFLDSILVFTPWDGEGFWSHTSYTEVYFVSPKLYNFLIFILVAISTFLIMSVVGYLKDKYNDKFFNNTNKKKNDKVYLIIFLCIILMWLPYILTFFPGGYYGDVAAQIEQVTGERPLSNHNPVFHTFIIWVLFKLSMHLTGSFQLGYCMLGLIQILMMSMLVSYFIYWWYKKGINKLIIISLTLFFGLFKLIPLYAVTIWKETPFSLLLVLLTFQIADLVLSKGEKLKDKKFICLYILNMLLISFLRNNGIYAIAALNIILYIVYKMYKDYKKFMISTLVTMLIIIIVQGPLFNKLRINVGYQEKVGVPLQQMYYVVVMDGNITDEQMEYLGKVANIRLVKAQYSPWNIDYVKFNSDINTNLIVQDKIKFFKTWIELILQNPDLCLKAYLLNTTGFWNINRVYNGDLKDYACPITALNNREKFEIYQINIIYALTGYSLDEALFDYDYENEISSAIFIFLSMLSMVYVFKEKKYKLLLIYLPIILTLGTIFIATPIAFGLRYVYFVVLFTPFAFLFPLLDVDVNKKELG